MSVATTADHHVEAVVELLSEWADYGRSLLIASGETVSVDTGTVERYGVVENAGTLQNAGTVTSGVNPWSVDPPTVKQYWDDAQGERGPGADQPGICYVWSPTTSTLERFSRDKDKFEQENNVEVQMWSLDKTVTQQLQADVTKILSKYLDDNEINTPYSDLAPVGENDFREQKPARQTDHYVMSVEIETTGLSDTGNV